MALSAPRVTRKHKLLVKIEADKGTYIAVDTAIKVFDLDIAPTAEFIERKGSGVYLGQNNAGVLGALSASCSFQTELRGNGSSGLEAGLAILLQACGYAKTSEVYNASSDYASQATISIAVWQDGKKKTMAGCSGNVTFEGETGDRLMCSFEFSGKWAAPIDDTISAVAESTATPMMLKGGTFTLGGESIKVASVNLNMNCQVTARPDIDDASGIGNYIVADWDPTLQLVAEADLVGTFLPGYNYYGIWLAGTEAAVSLLLTDGTVNVTFAIPAAQIKEIKNSDGDGIEMEDLTYQCNNSSGDDAVTITAAAAA